MRNLRAVRHLVLAAALSAPLLAATGVQAAGLFDAIGAIFGGDLDPPPSPRSTRGGFYDGQGGLDLTVRPRRPKPRREKPVVRRLAPAPALAPAKNLNFDPATNPNWFLDDPTLRAGDIVVVKGDVLVFEGGGPAPHAREDFTSLNSSRLSAEERERLRQMARLPAGTPASQDARRKTATATPE